MAVRKGVVARSQGQMKKKPRLAVLVYSTPMCPYCVMAKDFLNKHKVRFKEIDISVNEKAAAHMVEKTGQLGVPVIQVGKKYVVGFDRLAISNALGLK